ncbi:MAG: metallopeptidase family protein [Polyangiaceae bacterium]
MASKRVRLLPASVHLPSGRRVRLSDAAAVRARDGLKSASKQGGSGPFAEALAVLSGEGVIATEGGALDVLSLPVRDVHVLRALVTWAGLVEEEAEEFTCENCEAPFEIAPSAAMEIGPFVDGELSDPELDAAFPFGEALPIPRIVLPGSTGRLRAGMRRSPRIKGRGAPEAITDGGRPARSSGARSAETITFAPRTGEEARALFEIADGLISGRSRSLRVTPAVVIGMGVAALGTERRASAIAEALMDASNAAWAKVLDHWHDAAYPRRLFAVHRCAKCGARNDLDVPLARELLRESASFTRARSAARKPFPSLDAFEATVRAHADRIYAEKGVRNVDLFVDADVPHVDEGGEPLLGSYLPGGVDEDTGVPRPPEIRLYYRTFKSEAQADPDFDVEGEIVETIDHELTHHLHHLSGEDPLDDEEHAEIDREEARRVGSREMARRGRRAALSSVTGFLRTTWPLWVAVVIAAIILAYSQS